MLNHIRYTIRLHKRQVYWWKYKVHLWVDVLYWITQYPWVNNINRFCKKHLIQFLGILFTRFCDTSIFGNYINWVKILNTSFNACVLQNGVLSKQFLIQRGCRHGDLLASYLFLLCAEIKVSLLNKSMILGVLWYVARNIKSPCMLMIPPWPLMLHQNKNSAS